MADELTPLLARVVAAADDERRRIERELHDAAQQHLVALAINAQIAREVAESDVPAALELLDEVTRDARAALEAVRALAARVYPPLLLDRGLADALRAVASASRISARVEIGELARYTPDVEAAAYFCCADALDAAIADQVCVRAWQEGEALRLEVAPGALPAASIARERIVALGGRVEADDGRVAATIPLLR